MRRLKLIRPILAYMIRDIFHAPGSWRCNLCGLVCVSKSGLGKHLSVTHQTGYEWKGVRVLRARREVTYGGH